MEGGDEGVEGSGLCCWGKVMQGKDGFEVCEERSDDVVGVCVEVDWETERRGIGGCFAFW